MLTDALKSERQALIEELAELVPKQKRLELINQLLEAYGESAGSSKTLYSSMSKPDAILAFLKSSPNELFKPSEISKALIAGGINGTDNIRNVIGTTCGR